MKLARWLLTVALLSAVAVAVVLVGLKLGGLLKPFGNPDAGADPTVVIVRPDGAAVLKAVRGLNRLETIEYPIQLVMTGETSRGTALSRLFEGDKVQMLINGEVVAGVDFAKLRPGDITAVDTSVVVRLPSAEIFSTRIDPNGTRVLNRETGLFSKGDPNTQTAILRDAERTLTDMARRNGVERMAQQNAERNVRALLEALGFKQIQITFGTVPPPPA